MHQAEHDNMEASECYNSILNVLFKVSLSNMWIIFSRLVKSVSGFMSALQYKLPNCFAISTKLSLHYNDDRL